MGKAARPTEYAPLKGVQFVEPGHRVFGATRDGYEPARSEVDVTKGGVMDVALELKPKAATGGVNPAIAGVGFAVGGAGVIAAIALTVVANGKSGEARDASAALYAQNKHCPASSTDPECVSFYDTAKSKDTMSNAALGVWVCGVVLLGSIIYTATAAASATPGTQVAGVVPLLGPGLAGVSAFGNF